jgi:shikimate kinase
VLIGLRSSGKSTVARVLSARIGLPAVDLDELVRASFDGRTVTDIWEHEGEPAFRAAESRSLAAAIDGPPSILALGGGTPMIAAAASRLDAEVAAGRIAVVYLRGSVERLARRLAADRGDRPSLPGGEADESAVAEVTRAMQERDARYRRLAGLVVDLDDVLGDAATEPVDGAERVAAAIQAWLGAAGATG